MDTDTQVTPEKLVQFVTQISKLAPIDFIGVLKLMDVRYTTDESRPRDFDQLLSELIDRYVTLGEEARAQLDEMIAPNALPTNRRTRRAIARLFKRGGKKK